jgi:hypothetical protein
MRALQGLVETAAKIDRFAKNHREMLDRNLLDEVDALNDQLQTILLPSNPSSSTLPFHEELKIQIVSFASSIVLRELMKRLERPQFRSNTDIRGFLRKQIALMSRGDSPLLESDLGKLLSHPPVKPKDLTTLILKSHPDIKVPITMLDAMVPRTATFLVRKMKLATDLRGDSIDETAIRSIMTYDKWLRTEIVKYRSSYRILGAKLKEQCSTQAAASGAPEPLEESLRDLYDEAGKLGQIADAGPTGVSTAPDHAKSAHGDSKARMRAKPSDLFLFLTRKKDAIIQDSIMTISQLSGGIILSPETWKSLQREFSKTLEMLLSLMAKQILLDEPVSASTVLHMLNQNIETDPKLEQTLAPVYAKIIGSVVVTKSGEVWT